jgi:hypothetical protein
VRTWTGAKTTATLTYKIFDYLAIHDLSMYDVDTGLEDNEEDYMLGEVWTHLH